MINGCMNWDNINALYIQDNNSIEIIDGPELNWCNVTMDTLAWAGLTKDFDNWVNPFGATWKIQPEDYISCFYRSPFNISRFKAIRNLDLTTFPPERVPQYRPLAMKEVFNIDCEFRWEGTFEVISELLAAGNCVGLALKNPSHYICAVASDSSGLIGFKDPWSGNQWPLGFSTPDSNGNKWMSQKDFDTNIAPYYLLYKKRS